MYILKQVTFSTSIVHFYRVPGWLFFRVAFFHEYKAIYVHKGRVWFLAFLAFSFLLAVLGNMISPIAAKAQGLFHKNCSSLCYRLLFEAFTVVEIMWLLAQGALASGCILAGRPGPVCHRGVWIFVCVADKTQAFGMIRW